MRLCNEAITVFNVKFNSETDKDEYYATVITGVSWFCEIVSAVDQGLKAANKFVIRIPQDADFDGKTYVDPLEYAKKTDVTGFFTLKNGDIVVHGVVTEPIPPAPDPTPDPTPDPDDDTDDTDNDTGLDNGAAETDEGETEEPATPSSYRPADLHKNFEAFTILGVTDNRRAPKSPHWKVVGA